jgi:4-hydroxyproline epimerase
MSGPKPVTKSIRVIDSHTAGEPTRVVIDGGPDLGRGSMAERRERFRRDFDRYRSAIVNEPRGSDPVVGALLCPPADPSCAAGVIFFNNVGYLNMCGHGAIGVVATLAHLGRITPGIHRLETPVGVVAAELLDDARVNIANVRSYRHRKDVEVDAPGIGRIRGDVAWGGNWFYLVSDHAERLELNNIERLTDVAWRIRQSLAENAITGADGAEIDHVELFGPATGNADSRNFVLCPGKAYDRSPCGTGTSAKLACLHADNKLRSGQVWRQESIVGTIFEGWVEENSSGGAAGVMPTVRGQAHVNAEATLILDERDPFCWGIRHA